ncbi:MAG: pyridoxine 5'-phosphate synthase [Helicobacteraceae bacterium]|jgi:pyridoxine 5-phosphate synthase|nr:pyridoxine 5'-phosphate synthase [Helicobacteraceae bacterium]
MRLGINIDHIAVLKAARKVGDPDILPALHIAALSSADQITIHLREDRRHITDYDARRVVKYSPLPVNLECAFEVLDIVCELRPHRATLVPERREEVTTEGGLDVETHFQRVKGAVERLKEKEIAVSLFIEPRKAAADLALRAGADMVELHTGRFANLYAALRTNISHAPYMPVEFAAYSRESLANEIAAEIAKIRKTAVFAAEEGLKVAAGHGLNYQNVSEILQIAEIEELNIGQSIIARSIWIGFEEAVREMARLVKG